VSTPPHGDEYVQLSFGAPSANDAAPSSIVPAPAAIAARPGVQADANRSETATTTARRFDV